MSTSLAVGLGEIKISKACEDVLVAYGLGSCLGVACYDRRTKIAGLLHAVLPNPRTPVEELNPKYVDLGIKDLIRRIEEAGGSRENLEIKIAGGANMLNSPGFKNILNIGQRNMEKAEEVLKHYSIPIVGKDVGGNRGRTVRFFVGEGKMTIRRLGGDEIEI